MCDYIAPTLATSTKCLNFILSRKFLSDTDFYNNQYGIGIHMKNIEEVEKINIFTSFIKHKTINRYFRLCDQTCTKIRGSINNKTRYFNYCSVC